MRSSPFINLVREINSKIGQVEASSFKLYYKDVVDSTRTLSEISNVEQLCDILLDRDAIWETNVQVLENLVKRVGQADQNVKESLLQTISMYKKLQCDDSPSRCDVCEVPIELELPRVENISFAVASAPEQDYYSEEQEFDLIVLYLSDRLAQDWRRLGTSLGLEQGLLDTIQMERTPAPVYISNMLHAWKKQNGAAATKEVLVTKLNSKHVLRRDLVDAINKEKYK